MLPSSEGTQKERAETKKAKKKSKKKAKKRAKNGVREFLPASSTRLVKGMKVHVFQPDTQKYKKAKLVKAHRDEQQWKVKYTKTKEEERYVHLDRMIVPREEVEEEEESEESESSSEEEEEEEGEETFRFSVLPTISILRVSMVSLFFSLCDL